MGSVVFLDLEDKDLSVYTLEKKGKNLVLRDRAVSPVADGYSFAAERPKDMEESYLSLPVGLLNFRIIELPFSDKKKIAELIPFEIEGLILDNSREVIFDTYVLGENNGKYIVLVACIRKKIFGAILKGLRASGFDPKTATSIGLSLSAGIPLSKEEIASRLLDPGHIAEEKRIKRALEEIKRPTLNFRSGEFAYTVESDKTKRSLRMTAALAVLLFAVLLSDGAVKVISLKNENGHLKDEIRKTYQGMFPGEKKIASEVYQLKAHIKELKDREGSFVGVSPLGLLYDLTKITRPGMTLSEVTVDRDLIVLKGECPSLSDAQKIKDDMEGFFTGVNISDTRISSQNRALFTITAKGRKT